MPDEVINVILQGQQPVSESQRMTAAIESLERVIQRVFAQLDAMGSSAGAGFSKITTSITSTVNAATGLGTTVTSATTSMAGGMRVVTRETDSMAQRMRIAKSESDQLISSLERMAGIRFQQAQNISARRLEELGMGVSPIRPIGESYTGVSGRLFKGELEANLASQARAQLAESEFNRQMQAEIANRRSIRPEVMQDLEKRAGYQGGQLLRSSIALEPILNKQGQVIGQNAQAYIKMADGQLRAINTNDTFSQSVQRGSGFLSDFHRRVVGIATGILVWQAFREVIGTVGEVNSAIADLSAQTVRFGLITGQSLSEARESYLALQSVTTQQGIMPDQAAPVIQRAARFAPGDTQGQTELARGASIFANLFGLQPERAVGILTAALKQQGLTAADTMKVLDMLIAVYRTSAGSVEEISNALTEATTIQSKWGTGYQETVGLIAEVSGVVDESAETVTSALVRVTDVLEGLSGDKALEFARAFQAMGISVQDASGELLDPLAMIQNIAQVFGTLEPEMQNQVLRLLGLLKPTYQQVGRGLMTALADGQISNLDIIAGAGEKAGQQFAESYAGAVNRAMALQQEVFQRQGAIPGLVSRLGTGALEFAGQPEAAAKLNEQLRGAAPGLGTTEKENFLKSIMGLSEEEASQAIQDWNNRVSAESRRQQQELGIGILNPFAAGALQQATDALKFSTIDEGIARWKALKKSIDETSESLAPFAKIQGVAADLVSSIKEYAAKKTGAQTPEVTEPEAPANPLRDLFLFKGAQDVLPTNPVDLSALSQEQYNQALEESKAQFEAILELQAQQMALAGLTKEQIQEQIDAIRKVADETYTLVELEGKRFEYIKGSAGAYLQDAAQRIKRAAKADESDFAFRRLKDVDPSQFGQLAALTNMYNTMLTKLGSPEKEKNINLLLGEQNVFKTLTGRMSALQMALEDLTKVEKAQLSGTWNLPAGATALVPISSLDIQRWNTQGGGGGMSPEALMAFMQQFAGMMGGGGGDGGGGTVRRGRVSGGARTPITERQAIERSSDLEMHREQLARRRAQAREMADDEQRERPSRRASAAGENTLTSMRRTEVARTAQRIENVVNVAIPPLKATLNVNIPVLLNGQVIARMVQTLFYQLMQRSARSTNTRTDNTIRGVR